MFFTDSCNFFVLKNIFLLTFIFQLFHTMLKEYPRLFWETNKIASELEINSSEGYR